MLESIGSQWEAFCDNLSDKARKENEKSQTLKKKVSHYRRENMRSRQAEKELSKTREFYERSLTDIRNVYEKSHSQMNNDINDLEMLTKEFKKNSNNLRIKHVSNMKIVEQEVFEEDALMT